MNDKLGALHNHLTQYNQCCFKHLWRSKTVLAFIIIGISIQYLLAYARKVVKQYLDIVIARTL
jgi:hypothetical protein